MLFLAFSLATTFSLNAQNDAMQFTFGIENGGEQQEVMKYVLTKEGGMYLESANGPFSVGFLIENVHDRQSTSILYVDFNGDAFFVQTTLDSVELCEENSMVAAVPSESEVIRIEKKEGLDFRIVKSDGTEADFHLSKKYKDYHILSKMGIIRSYQTMSVPDSMVVRSDRFNGTMHVIDHSPVNWKEVKAQMKKRMRKEGARKLSQEEICEQMAFGSFGF